ncbi:MAG: SusC/RagA family TonB-linked outer membrane protein, partial [Muribaculum sp.]|nr:SusC/RagA family TonB-linked outer membrane protein [Muribaculum sp.]
YESVGFVLGWQYMAWYATGDYTWSNRYMLSVSAVLESSSRFGKHAAHAIHLGKNSWGLFPSVSAAWVISNENFMSGASWLDLLKLRLSYAVTGNDNLPINATSTFFASTAFLGNYYGYTLNSIGNERLKWETTGTARAAIEAAFLNNRLAFTLEGYISSTKDLLMQKQLRDVAGIESYWTNGGDLQNRGVNFSVTGRVVNTRDWHLDLGATIGMYRNKVTWLADGDYDTEIAGADILTAVGQPVGVFYGYKTDGVFATQSDADAASLYIVNKDGSRTYYAAGDMRFVENKVDGRIDDNDRFVIGNPNPDFFGNFNFRLNWKHLTLSSIFTYSVGNDVYNALRANLESGSNIYNQSTAMNNRWRANGQVTDIPRATYEDPMGNSRFSDRWIEDGSYLKWKSIALSYELPIRSTVIQGLTFTFSMSNIYTWTKYLGPDPEFFGGNSPLYLGVDSGMIPSSREFNFGVKINL